MRSNLALAAAAVAALSLSGCGSGKSLAPAAPQSIELGWQELDGSHGIGFRLVVERIVITHNGWEVTGAVTNSTGSVFAIGRPHTFGGTKFGLFIRQADDTSGWRRMLSTGNPTPQLVADRFAPPLPARLEPGQTWKGRFSGAGAIPAGSVVRVAFGRFTTTDPVPAWLGTHVLAVTSRSARLPRAPARDRRPAAGRGRSCRSSPAGCASSGASTAARSRSACSRRSPGAAPAERL